MSPLTDPPLEPRSHYRRNLFIVSGGLALLAVAWWGFKVWIHSPQVPLASNLAVFALFNLNLIVFLLLVVLLFRNLVKLAFERRQKVLGARFKAKLVIAFLSLTLTPAILIFIIASNARLAATRSGSEIASVRARGVICHDRPQRSLHQPHALSWPPLPTIAFHRRSVSA